MLTLGMLLAHAHAQTSAPASSYASADTGTSTHEVTAVDYCSFLNKAATTTDPDHLYDLNGSISL